MYETVEDFEDELSRILAYSVELNPHDVAEILEREARKLRHPEILEGEILSPEA